MFSMRGYGKCGVYRQALEAHGIPADENYSMRRPGIDPTPIVGEIKDADEAHEHGVSEEDE